MAKVRAPETVVVDLTRREFHLVRTALRLVDNFGLIEDMDDAKALLAELDDDE